jgi:hypothetical protein
MHVICLRLDRSGQAWAALEARLREVGLHEQAATIDPDPRLVEPRVVVALTHRTALQRAVADSADSLLVLEDHCLLRADLQALLPEVLTEWRARDGSLLYLGGASFGRPAELLEGCQLLQRCDVTGCFAVAYGRDTMLRLLADMPAEAPRMSDWIDARQSFDRYLASQPDRFVAAPRLASLVHLLPYEDPATRDRFLP